LQDVKIEENVLVQKYWE